MLSELLQIAVLLLPVLGIYIFGMGFFDVFLARQNINYVSRALSASAYFGFLSVVTGLFFYRIIAARIAEIPASAFFVLSVFFLLLLLFPPIIKKSRGLSRIAKENDHAFFLRINYQYLLSKSIEILFQQIIILVVVMYLIGIYDDSLTVIKFFALFFSALHIPLVMFIGLRFSLLFTVSAALSSFVFPPLILGYSGGIVYSYIAHWMFYIILALVMAKSSFVRSCFRKPKRV